MKQVFLFLWLLGGVFISINAQEGNEPPRPTAGMTLIAPPEPNSQGSAQVKYPLRLPPGRQGMQPELAITYDSENDNGWLGLGWSLVTPTIELDTRWGVPRFSTSKETETYLYQGEQLFPVAHRGELRDRVTDATFHARVEGAFDRIIRRGDAPSNYWWEVTATDGTSFYYGGTPEEGHLPAATLRNEAGAIVRWGLVLVVDRNGNRIDYTYQTLNHAGNGGMTGRQLYLSTIRYTGHGSAPGPFRIECQLDGGDRPDVQISGRLGLKEVTAHRLQRIEIYYREELVRAYRLGYTSGAFAKTLLAEIVEEGADGSDFYAHRFDYFDDQAEAAYLPEEKWAVADDDIAINLNGFNALMTGETSILGGSTSNTFSAGGAATAGFNDWQLFSKDKTAGGTYAYGSSNDHGLIALVDINGDGRPDKVFQQDEQLFYRPNLGLQSDSSGRFGEKHAITGRNRFSRSRTTSNSFGFEGNPPFSFVGYEFTDANTETLTFFSDVNGDGLLDIVDEAVVWFNHLDAEGHPVFSRTSEQTPSPIVSDEGPDPDLFTEDPEELAAREERYPLQDVVRVWRAPFTGTVRVEAPVQLQLPVGPEAEKYLREDGVVATIQAGPQELWRQRIPEGDDAVYQPTGVNQIAVTAGERIYFRLHSVYDGAFDRVDWRPFIRYTDLDEPGRSPSGLAWSDYDAERDFVVYSDQRVGLPMTGTVTIQGPFQKAVVTDTVRAVVRLTRGGEPNLLLDTLLAPRQVVDEQWTLSVEVEPGDELSFRLETASQIDWSAIRWLPDVFYTAAPDMAVTDAEGNPLFRFCPSVSATMYNHLWQRPQPVVLQESGRFGVIPQLETGALPEEPDSVWAVGLHTPDSLLVSETYSLDTFTTDTLWFEGQMGDTVYLAYYVRDYNLANALTQRSLRYWMQGSTDTLTIQPGLQSGISDDDSKFGPLYRGWGQFVYRANGEQGEQPIDENVLQLDPALMAPEEEIPEDPDDLEGGFKPEEAEFLSMLADAKNGRWLGYAELTYVRADGQSASRLGTTDVLPFIPIPTGEGAVRIIRKSKSNEHSIAGGIGVSVATGTASITTTTSEVLSDLVDLNGDRYPDILTHRDVQYTTMQGSLETDKSAFPFTNYHLASSEAVGFTLGGSFVPSRTSNSGEPNTGGSNRRASKAKRRGAKSGKNAKNAGNTAGDAVGVSGNFSNDSDQADNSMTDINGDGLPDKVFANGQAALNLGYSFTDPEPWGFGAIQKGESTDGGAGLGFTLFNGSIAGGLSLTFTQYAANESLEDVNSDGLPDIVLVGDPVRVRFNTGASFSDPVPWTDWDAWDSGSATGESINAAITVCVPVLLVKVCFNPSSSTGRGVSRQHRQLDDVDGDGYLDWIASDEDGDLRVRRSAINRTNLLRRVERPLGGSFDLDYMSSEASYALPYTIWLLRRLETFDDVPQDGDHRTLTTFTYREPNYDRHERTFFGFGEVRTEERFPDEAEPLYRALVQEYDTRNYYRKGLLRRERILDAAGQTLQETRFTYDVRNVEQNTLLDPVAEQSANAMGYPFLTERVFTLFDTSGQPGLSRRTQYTYDQHGQLIELIDEGGGHPSERTRLLLTYHQDRGAHDLSQWATREILGPDGLLRKQETAVDERGNVVEETIYVGDNQPATTRYEVDAYGNVVRTVRPPNAQGERLTLDLVYEDATHTYPEEQTDSYGYTTRYTFDPRYGITTSYTDENGQTLERTLDSYGRLAAVRNPLDAQMGARFSEIYTYQPQGEVPFTEITYFDPATKNEQKRYWLQDAFGRSVQTQSPARMLTGPEAEATLGLRLSGRATFDSFERMVEQYYDRRTGIGQAGQFIVEPDPSPPFRFSYDVLDRIVAVEMPNGGRWEVTYGFGESPSGIPVIIITTGDPVGQRQVRMQDVRGRTVWQQQGVQQVEWTYDGLDRLVSRRDALGFTETLVYDGADRLLEWVHPARGRQQYTYDLAGNLTEEVTATLAERQQRIEYHYEYERLRRIDYPFHPEQQVRYYYGDAQADSNRVGRIWLMEDGSGARELWYDALGQVTKEVRTLLLNDIRTPTFVTTWRYDSWGRLLGLQYPDGETVTYTYEPGGRVQALSGQKGSHEYTYLQEAAYHPRGQLLRMSYGNGIRQDFRPDPVTNLFATLALKSGGSNLLAEAYTYDTLGRLIQTAATRDSSRIEEQFGYDAMNRLVDGAFERTGTENDKSTSWMGEYDAANRWLLQLRSELSASDTTQQQWDYAYDPAQPFAPQRINGAGRLSGPDGQLLREEQAEGAFEYRWDDANRLSVLFRNGYLTRYSYDAESTRVLESTTPAGGLSVNALPLGNTNHNQEQYRMFVNPYITVEQDRFVKHYFVEDTRIASKEGTGFFSESLIDKNQQLTAGNLDLSERIALLRETMLAYLQDLGLPPGHPTLPGSNREGDTPLPAPDYGGNPLQQAPAGWPQPRGRPDPSGPPGHPVWFEEPANSDNAEPGYGFSAPYDRREQSVWFYHTDPFGQIKWVTGAQGELWQEQYFLPTGALHTLVSGEGVPLAYGFQGARRDPLTDLLRLRGADYDAGPGLRLFPADEETGNLLYQPYQAVASHPHLGSWVATWPTWIAEQSGVGDLGEPLSASIASATGGLGEADFTGGPGLLFFSASASVDTEADADDPDQKKPKKPRRRKGKKSKGLKPRAGTLQGRGLVGNVQQRAFLRQFRERFRSTKGTSTESNDDLARQKQANRTFTIRPGDWAGINIPGNRAFSFRPDGTTTGAPKRRGAQRRGNGFRVRFRLPKH